MNQEAFLTVTSMLNQFKQDAADPDVLLATFEKGCAGIDNGVITETAQRYIDNRIKGQHTVFAPTVTQFVTEARRIADLWKYQDRPALPAPERHRGTPPFMVRKEQARTRFAGWSVFKENVGYDEARSLSKSGELPVGATWSGCLGTIFLPPIKE
jgi:hypothetical protein